MDWPELPGAPSAGGHSGPQGGACIRRLIETRDELLGFIFAHVRDWNVAEDVFQDVAVIVLEKTQQGMVIDNYRAYSREIARRLIRQHWRKAKSRPARLSDEALERIEVAFARREARRPPAEQELRTRLRDCMGRLPERFRLLLSLFYEERLSQREIAERLGSTEGAVQVAISRARHQLLRLTGRPC